MGRTAAPRRPAAPLQAYVLHRWNWSESSLILDLYTREQGRLVVAAKGAKRPTSQLRPVLLPFQRLHVVVGRVPKSADESSPLADDADAPAQREVQTLRSADWAGGPAMPAGAALFSGFYLNELLMRMTVRQDPSPALFDGYVATLAALRADDDAAVQAALRAFELLLLRTSGVLPDLSCGTVTQQPVQGERAYQLLPVTGVVAADAASTGAISGHALVTAEAALRHGSLPAVQDACRGALPAWRGALRGLIYHHLGSPLLRTRQVLRDVQGLAAVELEPTRDPARPGA